MPGGGGATVSPSAVHAVWLQKLFWNGDPQLLKRPPQSDQDYLHAYDTCAKYLDRLVPADAVHFLDNITFSPDAAEHVSQTIVMFVFLSFFHPEIQPSFSYELLFARQKGGKSSMTQFSVMEALFSVTVSDRNWWELGRQTICNCSTEGTVVGFRQPPRQDSYCVRGRVVGISNHYIKLSYSSLCALHRLTGRLSCPRLSFWNVKSPFPILNILLCSLPHSVASKHIPVMIYKRNYKIAQEMSAT